MYTCVYKLYIILYHPTLLADFIVVIMRPNEESTTFVFVARRQLCVKLIIYKSSLRGICKSSFILICTIRSWRMFVGFSCTAYLLIALCPLRVCVTSTRNYFRIKSLNDDILCVFEHPISRNIDSPNRGRVNL